MLKYSFDKGLMRYGHFPKLPDLLFLSPFCLLPIDNLLAHIDIHHLNELNILEMQILISAYHYPWSFSHLQMVLVIFCRMLLRMTSVAKVRKFRYSFRLRDNVSVYWISHFRWWKKYKVLPRSTFWMTVEIMNVQIEMSFGSGAQLNLRYYYQLSYQDFLLIWCLPCWSSTTSLISPFSFDGAKMQKALRSSLRYIWIWEYFPDFHRWLITHFRQTSTFYLEKVRNCNYQFKDSLKILIHLSMTWHQYLVKSFRVLFLSFLRCPLSSLECSER